jgi:branched-chain amino acid transport system substrate-binding protein
MTKRALFLFGASLVLLAACGGGAAPASSGPASPAGTAASPSTAPGAPASVAGSAEPAASASPAAVASTASGNPIRIGDIVPLAGVQSILGKDNQDGMNLYLGSINNTVAGRRIEVTYADDAADASTGLTKAKQLVEDQKVQLLMGFNATPVCYAVATYVQQAQVPMAITSNCAAQDVMTDPKYKSPYISRWTITNGAFAAAGDWLEKQGYKKVSVFAADFGAGHEFVDAFSAGFVDAGGSVVQVQYPKVGTTDYGPVLAQLDSSADSVATFLPGVDGLRFFDQYASSGSKRPALDTTNSGTAGPPLDQLKDKAVGLLGTNIYSLALDTPQNQNFLKQFAAKFPGRSVSSTVANGYASAQVLEAALKKINGAIENKQEFLDALDSVNIETAKGPVKLDANHDIIENVYAFQVVKDASGGYGQKLLGTREAVGPTFTWTQQQMAKLQVGKDAIKWTTMDKAKLDQLMSG